ncbi:hypothetical protein HGB07_05260 [Candidatus Roizmanbacteria bacterium]|nr:hypothetical protein [Candidatus Roizmanbacteria bacterium]
MNVLVFNEEPCRRRLCIYFKGIKKKKDNVMANNTLYKFRVMISTLFLVAYFGMLAAIFFVEVSDKLNMIKVENSLMSLLGVLLGVLTAGIGQVLNYWLNDRNEKEFSVT